MTTRPSPGTVLLAIFTDAAGGGLELDDELVDAAALLVAGALLALELLELEPPQPARVRATAGSTRNAHNWRIPSSFRLDRRCDRAVSDPPSVEQTRARFNREFPERCTSRRRTLALGLICVGRECGLWRRVSSQAPLASREFAAGKGIQRECRAGRLDAAGRYACELARRRGHLWGAARRGRRRRTAGDARTPGAAAQERRSGG